MEDLRKATLGYCKMGYLHSENVLFCVLHFVTFVNANMERCKEVFEYLTRGGYPEGYTKSQKLSLRRYSQKFAVKGK